MKEIKYIRGGIQKLYDELNPKMIAIQKAEPPYIKYEKGFGFMGIILLDTEIDRVQCHICGFWLKALGPHLRKHNIKTIEYKKGIGLYLNEPLTSISTRNAMSGVRANHKQIAENLAQWIKEHGMPSRKGKTNQTGTSQFKNRHGTCDAQLRERFENEMDKLGRFPVITDNRNLYNALVKRWGSWDGALMQFGYDPKKAAVEKEKKRREKISETMKIIKKS